MRLENQSELRTLIMAYSLVSERLRLGREPAYQDYKQAVHFRVREKGFYDEAEVDAFLKKNLADNFIKVIDHLCNVMFAGLEDGLPQVHTGRIVNGLMRVLDPDTLLCLHFSSSFPHDEPFDWGGIPVSAVKGLTENESTVETHLHLGGALPPLYFWTMMMGGGMNLTSPLSCISDTIAAEDLAVWRAEISRAAWIRLFLANRLREINSKTKDNDPFSHLLDPLDDETLKGFQDLSFGVIREPFREVCFRLMRKCDLKRLKKLWPLPDPLRPIVDGTHYAAGERILLYELGRFIRRAGQSPEAMEIEKQLLEYLRIRNAFHRLMVHDEGTTGLFRFLESFGQRGSLSAWSKTSGRSGGRRRRGRRLTRNLERHRMATALNEQLIAPFGAARIASGCHRLEMRVSLPGKGSTTKLTLAAWLRGIQDHLRAVHGTNELDMEKERNLRLLELQHSLRKAGLNDHADLISDLHEESDQTKKANAHIGLVFHFIKMGPKSENNAIEQARRLGFFLKAFPGLRPFVVGIDAAGKERGTAPRDFARAYALMQDFQQRFRSGRNKPKIWLGYTYHVGEDVDDFLIGLRHVDEVVHMLHPATGGRVGHGLILAEDPTRFYFSRGGRTHPPFKDYLLSLVWAWGCFNRIPDPKEAKRIRHLVDSLNLSITHSQLFNCFKKMNEKEPCHFPTTDLVNALASQKCAVSEAKLLATLGLASDLPEHITVYAEEEDFAWLRSLQTMLLEKLAKKAVWIEVNPSSNLLMGGYQSYRELPYRKMVDFGLPVTINTDDPGMFMTSLPNEFSVLFQGLVNDGFNAQAAREWLKERCQQAKDSTFLPISPPELAYDVWGGHEQISRIFSGK